MIPKDNTHIPFVVELKVDSTLENAISQIKEKEYFNFLDDYKGQVLLLSYDSKKLKHCSKVEMFSKK